MVDCKFFFKSVDYIIETLFTALFGIEEFASYLLIFNNMWSPDSLGDILQWVGVRHRPDYVNVFFPGTTQIIFYLWYKAYV